MELLGIDARGPRRSVWRFQAGDALAAGATGVVELAAGLDLPIAVGETRGLTGDRARATAPKPDRARDRAG